MTQNNLTDAKKIKWLWIITAVFFVLAVKSIVDKGYLSAVLLVIGDFLILPPLTDFWNSKLPFLSNKFIKGGVLLALLLVGSAINPEYIQRENEAEQYRKKMKFLTNYIKTDETNKSIRNIKDIEAIFNDLDTNISEVVDPVTKKKVFVFNPKFYFNKIKDSPKYYQDKGDIKGYKIFFDVDPDGKIISEKTVITFYRKRRC